MRSPWVRHEASQAVVRGVYAPARIDPMRIESPYDRIQATDLINWAGDINHPGFQNLLARVTALMPPPVPVLRRFTLLAARNKGLIVASTIALFSVLLLVRMRSMLDSQIEKQTQIANEITRSSQPLRDIQVSAYIDMPSSTPGVTEYVRYLENSRLVVREDNRMTAQPLPPGTYVSRSGPKGVEEITIAPGSALWPTSEDVPPFLSFLARYVELAIGFRLNESKLAGVTKPDLKFDVGAYDPDGSDGPRGNSYALHWECGSGKLSVHFSDVPVQKYWESNGKIISVPDLERSLLIVSFRTVMMPRNGGEESHELLRKSRAELRLASLFLDYSGRRIHILGTEMTEALNEHGLRQYSIRLDARLIQRSNAR